MAMHLPGAEYSGADLFAGAGIQYVGDITKMEFDRTFDAVVALDILEHLDSLSTTFDRLMAVAERYLLISLPNTYDLKSRFKFAVQGQLGGKYVFTEEAQVDRHHWLMSYAEIRQFAEAKARKHRVQLQLFDMTYGASGNRSPSAIAGRLLTTILPRQLTTATVFALFTR